MSGDGGVNDIPSAAMDALRVVPGWARDAAVEFVSLTAGDRKDRGLRCISSANQLASVAWHSVLLGEERASAREVLMTSGPTGLRDLILSLAPQNVYFSPSGMASETEYCDFIRSKSSSARVLFIGADWSMISRPSIEKLGKDCGVTPFFIIRAKSEKEFFAHDWCVASGAECVTMSNEKAKIVKDVVPPPDALRSKFSV
jgi:hypothetical protein